MIIYIDQREEFMKRKFRASCLYGTRTILDYFQLPAFATRYTRSRGNGTNGKERTNKIQPEHSGLPCDRPNLVYFQKIKVIIFFSSISAVRNPKSSNLISWFREHQRSMFSHPEGKKIFSLSIAANKLSQLQNVRLNLLTVTFLAIENSTVVNLGRL